MQTIGIKERIMEELKNMGYNFRHIGTIYMVETIEIIYNSQNYNAIKSIEKNVYKQLAEKHDKNVETIKSDVIKATDYMYEQFLLEEKKVNKNYKLYPKITPKSVINTIVLKLSA